MGKHYTSIDERNRRLHQTVCMFRNYPVYVSVNSPYNQPPLGTHEVFISPILSKNEMSDSFFDGIVNDPSGYGYRINYTTDDFNDREFSLGYFNSNGEAIYCARHPTRTYNQGLQEHNIVFFGNVMPNRSRHGNWMRGVSFARMLCNKYPDRKEAEEGLGDGRETAVSRSISLAPFGSSRTALKLKGEPIGWKGRYYSDYEVFNTPLLPFFKDELEKANIPYVVEKH